MRVLVAEKAGACYGVKRALDMVTGALGQNDSITTLGPLIHNPSVVEDFSKKGVRVAEAIEDIEGDTVIVRSHGVTPSEMDSLRDRGLQIVDATCPHVKRAQDAASSLAKKGLHVLVVGESGHPEVEGLVGYASMNGADVDVVDDVEDIPESLPEKVGIVVQTTQTQEKLDSIVQRIRQLGIEPVIKNTICSATSSRQKSALDLSSTVDAMVVIGGKNSSNTTRLFEICSKQCPRAFHVESPDELTADLFEGCDVVGITAGASTPEAQIDSIISVIEGF